MANHVHLLLTPDEHDSTASLMKNFGQRYVQFVNRTYRHSGTLREGRFRSCLVQNARYTLACYRYIEMKPLRTGIVSRPVAYHWSIYPANGQGTAHDWLVPHPAYIAPGHTPVTRRVNYRKIFRKEMDPVLSDEIRTATSRMPTATP